MTDTTHTEAMRAEPASAFGARLRCLRKAKKLTLQQVADAVGCTKAYIWELEMKDGQRPSAERIQAIAKALGVTMADVMGEPIKEAPNASPEDVAFFREYVGMTDEKKDRYRQALKIMLPSPPIKPRTIDAPSDKELVAACYAIGWHPDYYKITVMRDVLSSFLAQREASPQQAIPERGAHKAYCDDPNCHLRYTLHGHAHSAAQAEGDAASSGSNRDA